MKKFIGYIIFFFAIIIVVDFCFGKVCDNMNSHSKGGLSKQTYDLCMKDKYDVLIMGSSRAHHHYVPQIIEDSLGMTCYNAGYDGNGIILMTGIYRLIIQRYQPKIIIYDVEQAFDLFEYLGDNNRTRYLSTLRPYYNEPGIAKIFKDVSMEEWYKVHSGLCRYNSVSISLAIDYFKNRPVYAKGYAPLNGEMKIVQRKSRKNDIHIIDSLKLKYMAEFIKEVSGSEVQLFVCLSPKYGMTDSRDFEPIKEICAENSVPFMDYYSNEEFMANMAYFKEGMHLNDRGARFFTNLFIRDLRNNIELIE